MKRDHTIEKSGIFCEFEKGHGGPCGFVPKNARYDNGWYYCWLIERRDLPQPAWWAVNCTWTTDANKALWFARESDAQADAGECPHDVVVCEHGFDLRLRSAPSPLDEGMREDALQDLAYYEGAKQALVIASDSLKAADEWLAGGCGGRKAQARAALAPVDPLLAAQKDGQRTALEMARRYIERIGVQYAQYMDDMDAGSWRATLKVIDSQLAGKGDL